MISLDPISTIFGCISNLNSIIKNNNEKDAIMIELLEELKFNFNLIGHDYLKNNLPIEFIIPVIKTKALEKAEKERKRRKLNLNEIKSGKLNRQYLQTYHQKKYYEEFDTERLLLKLREKQTNLKKIKSLYFKRGKWNKKINPKSRMNSYVSIVILISNHLNE